MTGAPEPLPLIRPEWPMPQGVQAFMSTRVGGVSGGRFASLNLGAMGADDPEAVRRNRARLRQAAALPGDPVWLQQVHGQRVLALDTFSAGESPPEADGSWTAGGAICAVLAADCMPVLLARRDGSAVAAVHAGWRGLAGGVLEAALKVLPGPSCEWQAWLGPRIGPQYFIVRRDVRDAFPRETFAFAALDVEHWHADLAAIARRRLEALGVAVYDSCLCTATDAERFYSHRRDGECGRMAALIWRHVG